MTAEVLRFDGEQELDILDRFIKVAGKQNFTNKVRTYHNTDLGRIISNLNRITPNCMHTFMLIKRVEANRYFRIKRTENTVNEIEAYSNILVKF